MFSRVDEVSLIAQGLRNDLLALQSTSSHSISEQGATLRQLTSLIVQQQSQTIIRDPAVKPSHGLEGSVGRDDAVQKFPPSTPKIPVEPIQKDQLTKVYDGVRVRTTHYAWSSCSPWCSCICHKRHSFRTPRMLNQMIGSLFIGYSGFAINTPPCNEFSCLQRSRPSTAISYYFPPWFLARVISMVVMLTPLHGPLVSICAPRVIPSDSRIFTCARNGDVQGIKFLFEKQLASPCDITEGHGVSALQVSVIHNLILLFVGDNILTRSLVCR